MIRHLTPNFDKLRHYFHIMAIKIKELAIYRKVQFKVYKITANFFLIFERTGCMENYVLKPLIERVRNQDMSAFSDLFDGFKRLINYYAAKLSYEDAANELTLFFIELLYSIKLSKFSDDGSDEIRRYIAVSLKNEYIALSMKKAKSCKLENDFYESYGAFSENSLENLVLSDILKLLNANDKKIIIYRYLYGYSIAEIADLMDISRQAVNKRKNNALNILKKAIEKDEAVFL